MTGEQLHTMPPLISAPLHGFSAQRLFDPTSTRKDLLPNQGGNMDPGRIVISVLLSPGDSSGRGACNSAELNQN
jgi:hypothetical protein